MRLNTKQALAYLGCAYRNTLYQHVRTGQIKQHKVDGRNYYDPADLDRYLAPKRGAHTHSKMRAYTTLILAVAHRLCGLGRKTDGRCF